MNSIVENDLKHIIHLLWNKPNVNMWDFEIYKALTYLFVKLFRDKHYKEKYYSLVQSIEKTETAWQRYLIDLLYETLRSDNGVPAYEKEKLIILLNTQNYNSGNTQTRNPIIFYQKYFTNK